MVPGLRLKIGEEQLLKCVALAPHHFSVPTPKRSADWERV